MFQSTPPSTAATRRPGGCSCSCPRRFNPRRPQRAATRVVSKLQDIIRIMFQSTPPSTGGDTQVGSFHESRTLQVSIHAALNGRRHLDPARRRRKPRRRFNPRRPQRAATLLHVAHPHLVNAVSIHAALNGRRHAGWIEVHPGRVVFQSTPPSTGGDTFAASRSIVFHSGFQSTPPSTGGDTGYAQLIDIAARTWSSANTSYPMHHLVRLRSLQDCPRNVQTSTICRDLSRQRALSSISALPKRSQDSGAIKTTMA